MDKCAKANV